MDRKESLPDGGDKLARWEKRLSDAPQIDIDTWTLLCEARIIAWDAGMPGESGEPRPVPEIAQIARNIQFEGL